MNERERKQISELWAIAQVSAGVADPDASEEWFPKGRLPILYRNLCKMSEILMKMVIADDKRLEARKNNDGN